MMVNLVPHVMKTTLDWRLDAKLKTIISFALLLRHCCAVFFMDTTIPLCVHFPGQHK